MLTGCQNEARWYPDADVEIGKYYEYADTSGPKLAIPLIIHNTSKTSILSSTLTIQIKTNKHEYFQTASFSTKIIPDGKVALTISVSYLEADERVIPDGITLYDSFFD
jgi:hypothetical protein